jgi:hypothetical protein
MDILNNPLVSESAKWLLLLLAGLILQSVRKLVKRMTLVEYKLRAADYALEKTISNGYAVHRDHKLRELLSSDKFINEK